MWVCDTNILIYAHDQLSPFNQKAKFFLEENFPQKIYFTPQVFLEFFNITTKRKGRLLTPKQALEIINQFSLKERLLLPKNQTHLKAVKLCYKYQLKGAVVFDAYLVATCLDNNIDTIATANTKDFVKFKEIKLFSPCA